MSLYEGTKIPTSLGLLDLSNLLERDTEFNVLSCSGEFTCCSVEDEGDSESVLLIFKSGKEIECSLGQEFQVIRDEKRGWVKACDIRLGDKFLMSRRNSPFGEYKVNPGEAFSWGVDGKSYEVPYQVLKSSRDIIASYLHGVLRRKCSMCFNESEVMLSVLSIEKDFIHNIGNLLSMIGVKFRIAEYVLEKSSLFELIIDDSISLTICDIIIFKRSPRYDVGTINVLFDDVVMDIQKDRKCHVMKLSAQDSYCVNGFMCR